MSPTTSRVTLQTYTLNLCHEFYQNYISDLAMTYHKYIYDKEKVDLYYQEKVMQSDRCFFAICYQDKIIGEVQLKRINWDKKCGTVSIHLNHDDYKNKGFGSEALKLLIEYGFMKLDLATIYADAIHRNTRSIHVLEKIGFNCISQDDFLKYFKLEKSVYLNNDC